jgi:hypothetical protein
MKGATTGRKPRAATSSAVRAASSRGRVISTAPGIGQIGKARKYFFFEKKKQKTFARCALPPQYGSKQTEVFWFFFSKKNCFLS